MKYYCPTCDEDLTSANVTTKDLLCKSCGKPVQYNCHIPTPKRNSKITRRLRELIQVLNKWAMA